MKKRYLSVFICVISLLIITTGCENNDIYDINSIIENVSSTDLFESDSTSVAEDPKEVSSNGNAEYQSLVILKDSSSSSLTQSVAPLVSSLEEASQSVNVSSNSSSASSSAAVNECLVSLSLSNLNEFEDWITGKNEFTERHIENKEEINKTDGFFDRKEYYRLSDKITGFEIQKIEFYWGQYNIMYESEKMNLYFKCSYGPESNKKLLEYLEQRKSSAKKSKFIEEEHNNILYTVQIPNEEIKDAAAISITWMQDDLFMTEFIYGQKDYTSDLLDYCIAQKVDLNSAEG